MCLVIKVTEYCESGLSYQQKKKAELNWMDSFARTTTTTKKYKFNERFFISKISIANIRDQCNGITLFRA